MKKLEFLGVSRATCKRHFKTSSTVDENVLDSFLPPEFNPGGKGRVQGLEYKSY